MTALFDRWRDHLGLGLLAAMVSLPFLHPRHFNPIPSFWAEWWAVALGLAAAAVLLVRSDAWRPARLPSVMLIPLIFCAAAVLQMALHHVLFVEQALLYAAMLLWAALMMLLGRHVRDRFGLERVADVLATAILAAALINATIAILQLLNATAFAYPWLFPSLNGHVPYGNLGQGNHLNHQMWLGVASTGYLRLRGRISFGRLWVVLLPLLFAATLTASRSVFLYAALLPLLGIALAWHPSDRSLSRHWLRVTLPLLPSVVMLQWTARNLPDWLTSLGVEAISGSGLVGGTATDRLFQEVSGTNIRLRLLEATWHSLLDAPLFGSGIGTLPWKLFLANSRATADWAPGVAEHAHNIVAQCLHDFGLVPTGAAGIVFALWLRRLFKSCWDPQLLWISGILAIAAIHSLLEYPLWYGFFLGVSALLLGMSDERSLVVHNGWRGSVLVGAIIAGGMAPLASLRSDYSVLESVINRRQSTDTWRADIDSLLRIQRNSLLAPHVLVTLAVTMEPTPEQLDAKVGVCNTAQRFAPSQQIVFKCAVLLQLSGKDSEATLQMQRALKAFPEARKQLASELGKLVASNPRLSPLAEMAAAAD